MDDCEWIGSYNKLQLLTKTCTFSLSYLRFDSNIMSADKARTRPSKDWLQALNLNIRSLILSSPDLLINKGEITFLLRYIQAESPTHKWNQIKPVSGSRLQVRVKTNSSRINPSDLMTDISRWTLNEGWLWYSWFLLRKLFSKIYLEGTFSINTLFNLSNVPINEPIFRKW